MKARDLAAKLLEHPDAEVVCHNMSEDNPSWAEVSFDQVDDTRDGVEVWYVAGGENVELDIEKKDRLESQAYAEQGDQITAKFGVEASERANYGWGVAEIQDGLSIATKVYGVQRAVLETQVNFKTGTISHEWME